MEHSRCGLQPFHLHFSEAFSADAHSPNKQNKARRQHQASASQGKDSISVTDPVANSMKGHMISEFTDLLECKAGLLTCWPGNGTHRPRCRHRPGVARAAPGRMKPQARAWWCHRRRGAGRNSDDQMLRSAAASPARNQPDRTPLEWRLRMQWGRQLPLPGTLMTLTPGRTCLRNSLTAEMSLIMEYARRRTPC